MPDAEKPQTARYLTIVVSHTDHLSFLASHPIWVFGQFSEQHVKTVVCQSAAI